jgi:hypothetical protein
MYLSSRELWGQLTSVCKLENVCPFLTYNRQFQIPNYGLMQMSHHSIVYQWEIICCKIAINYFNTQWHTVIASTVKTPLDYFLCTTFDLPHPQPLTVVCYFSLILPLSLTDRLPLSIFSKLCPAGPWHNNNTDSTSKQCHDIVSM